MTNNILKIIKDKGISIKRLSEDLEMDYSATHKLATRDNLATTQLGTVIKVANYLNVDIKKIYTRKGENEMKKYYVNFGTGAGNQEVETVEDGMAYAGENASYTQQRIEIRRMEDEEVVAYLPWWGTKAEEDDAVTCNFGDYGFYGEWIED